MGVNGHWYVELRKQAFWRGTPHTWVNRYVMSGAQPAAADALSVITALHDIEDSIFPILGSGLGVGFIDGKAYPSGKGSYFAINTYNEDQTAGTATGFSGSAYGATFPAWSNTLEVCFMLETPLAGLSSTGKPVFLRKFYRGMSGGSAESDLVGGIPGAILASIATATLPFKTGLGTNDYVVIGNNGEQASGAPVCRGFEYNRQIPKGRRKKPSTSAGLLAQIAADTLKLRGALGLAADAAGLAL